LSEDLLIANNDNIGTEFIEQSNNLFNKQLFEKIYSDQALLSNPILWAFYNQMYYNNIGFFNQVNVDIKSAYLWSPYYSLVYGNNNSLIKVKSDSVLIIDSLLIISPNDPFLLDNRNALNIDLDNLYSSNTNIEDIVKQIQLYTIENAENNNSNIAPTEIYEENEKIVNQIYTETVAKDILYYTQDQIEQLEQIIWQCPFEGGPAVYTARFLYVLVDYNIDFDDDDICAAKGIVQRFAASKDENSEYRIYPNPNSGEFTLTYLIADELTPEFQIFDLLGNLVYQKSIDVKFNKATFNVDFLNQGIYRCQIVNNERCLWQDKISIIR
jgi:hypothetical protein